MSSDPASPHATQLRNHWYWRPGWNPHRRFYTWHITFDGQDQLHHLVSTYQKALHDVPGLDLVPLRWLHLTMQGVGFTDEIQPNEARVIADAASHRLAKLGPAELTFHQPTIRPEALALPPTPTQTVVAIRDAIRDGIAAVRGVGRVPETSNQFDPHVSFAYVNTDAPANAASHALNNINPKRVQATVSKASLIILRRDGHLYRWEPFANASFSGEPST